MTILTARRVPLSLLVLVGLTATWWLASGRSLVHLGSGSMAPWAAPGDLLVQRTVATAELEVGDVVTVPAGDALVTNRVVEVTADGDGWRLRLQGDASDLPDSAAYTVGDEVDVVTRVVPGVGAAAAAAAPVLGAATVLVLVGWLAVARPDPGRTRAPDVSLPPAPLEPTGDVAVVPRAARAEPDPRVEALLATCEQLLDDGLAPVVVRDLARVRVCELLQLPSVERSGPARTLDDGGRFYVLALVDADADALAIVPPGSLRRRAGTEAVDRWWAAVSGTVPATLRDQVAALAVG